MASAGNDPGGNGNKRGVDWLRAIGCGGPHLASLPQIPCSHGGDNGRDRDTDRHRHQRTHTIARIPPSEHAGEDGEKRRQRGDDERATRTATGESVCSRSRRSSPPRKYEPRNRPDRAPCVETEAASAHGVLGVAAMERSLRELVTDHRSGGVHQRRKSRRPRRWRRDQRGRPKQGDQCDSEQRDLTAQGAVIIAGRDRRPPFRAARDSRSVCATSHRER